MNSASLPNAHKSADVLGRLMHTGNLTDLGVEWTITLRPLQSISRVQRKCKFFPLASDTSPFISTILQTYFSFLYNSSALHLGIRTYSLNCCNISTSVVLLLLVWHTPRLQHKDMTRPPFINENTSYQIPFLSKRFTFSRNISMLRQCSHQIHLLFTEINSLHRTDREEVERFRRNVVSFQ